MNIGPFFSDDPVGLTLTADRQFGVGSGEADIVWQLRFRQDAPLGIHSTLGLQAQDFQIFPQFLLNKARRSAVSEFLSPPRLDLIFSNFARFTLAPFEDVEAVADFWIKSGQLLLGRIRLSNRGDQNQELGASLSAGLVSLRGSSDLKHIRQGYQTFLKGTSGSLSVFLGMEGMSKTIISPNLGLEQNKTLTPDQSFEIHWQAEIRAKDEAETDKHNLLFPVNWDGEIARLEVANQARIIQVITPHAAWDACFYSNQNQAFQSLREDQSGKLRLEKYRNLHSAIKPTATASPENKPFHTLELWQLLMSLLPSQTGIAAEILANYLAESLDHRGKNHLFAPPFPCLALSAWKIHQLYQQTDYLQAIFPALLDLTMSWFEPAHDRDQDGMPEWQSLEHCGLETLESFRLADESGHPTRIRFTESAGLGCLLVSELEIMLKFAEILGDETAKTQLQAHLARLTAWFETHQTALGQTSTLDYQTHQPLQTQVLFAGPLAEFGSQPCFLAKASRLNLRFKPQLMLRKPAPFTIVGENQEGLPIRESVSGSDLIWLPGSFFVTTREVYRRLDRLEGLNLEDTNLQIYSAGIEHEDLSALFQEPLIESEPVEVASAPASSLPDWLAATHFGLPEVLRQDLTAQSVNPGWNCLLISRLIEKDERDLAFDLLIQLVTAQIGLYKYDHANSDRWNAQTGRAQGYKNAIGGLLPISLLLELAGITIFHENKVRLHGSNPFPWQIKFLYRGLEITRDGKNAQIRFPNGEVEHHFGSSMKTFFRESDSESEA